MEQNKIKAYVYIANIKSSPFYKIGKTKDLEQRLKTIQCSNPLEITYHKTYKFVTELDAHRFEKKIQKKFNNKNVRLEWFAELDNTDFAQIEEMYLRHVSKKLFYSFHNYRQLSLFN